MNAQKSLDQWAMGDYYAVHVPSSSSSTLSDEGVVFTSLKETSKFVNSPEVKVKGARFKKFRSPEDARKFAKLGKILDSGISDSDNVTTTNSESNQPAAAFEPTVPYPSVSRIQFNRLKKAIEKLDIKTFNQMVRSNPRFLINVGGDTPTIVVEGFRYNALHIAAKVGNMHVAKFVLDFVRDHTMLASLYGTSSEDVEMRSNVLLDCYLNTPDKGAHDTPLHFASKFGHHEIVEYFLSFNICQKNARNKAGLTPAEACCSRYSKKDKNALNSAIQSLFRSLYIPLYRPTDDYYCTTIKSPCEFQLMTPSLNDGEHSVQRPLLERTVLSAYAGPFSDPSAAAKFHEEWTTLERKIRLTNPKKGAERVGRGLALKYNVKWMEYWSFAGQLIDLNSKAGDDYGLDRLNNFLVKIKLSEENTPIWDIQINDTIEDIDDSVRDSDDSYEPSSEMSTDSLEGVADQLASLNLSDGEKTVVNNTDEFFDAQPVVGTDTRDNSCNTTQYIFVSNKPIISSCTDEECFITPPTSPEPIYIHEGIPSKEDIELVNALMQVDNKNLERYGVITEYMRQVLNVKEEERAHWPSTDSPTVKKKKRI